MILVTMRGFQRTRRRCPSSRAMNSSACACGKASIFVPQFCVVVFYAITFLLVVISGLFHHQVHAYSTSYSVHLISLPALPPTESSSQSVVVNVPQSIRDLWRWKDTALGNGQDYFIPRPRAIKSLISLLRGQTFIAPPPSPQEESPSGTIENKVCWTIDECAILSNCARMDVYLLCSVSQPISLLSPSATNLTTMENNKNTTVDARREMDSPKALVASILASQLEQYISSNNSHHLVSFTMVISSILDLPIYPINTQPSEVLWREVQEHLTEITGLEPIARHACLVACGMAPRPNRPDRQVPFRPFSSRDAHILLQLKRTVDIIAVQAPRIQRILQTSLSAGKAARDVRVVPQLLPLKKFSSDSNKYLASPPQKLTDAAAKAAIERAIEPAVERCISNLLAMDRSHRILNLRQTCEALVIKAGGDLNDVEGQELRKLLHLPTMALREGKDVIEENLLESVRCMLRNRGVEAKDSKQQKTYC